MRADPADQQRLLVLADMDTEAVRIGHRRRTLQEVGAVTAAEAAVVALRTSAQAAEAAVADLAARQSAADAEVEEVRARIDRNRRLMDGVVAAKELGHIQHETDTLTQRQSELEDVELEVMEELEAAQTAHAQVAHELAEAEAALAAAVARRDDILSELDVDAGDLAHRRAELVAGLPQGLVALYESVRDDTCDTGAALLSRGRCQGCHLDLPATTIDEVRGMAPDEVVQCEECRRVLVRTEASGL